MLEQLIRDIKEKGWGHGVNILTSHDISLMNEFFRTHHSEFVPAMIGKGDLRQRNTDVRGDYTLWIDPLNPPYEFKKALVILEDLKATLNREIFLGAKEYECHLAYYSPGTFYQEHVDRFENDSSRVLSFIFYLHNDWKEGDGGELVIHQEKEFVIPPVPGSLVVFLSEGLAHEVKVSKIERRSFTGWMHSKIIC